MIAVVGPTATGKTSLAIELALRLDAEIVNSDAMQLYRGMDIGTAKATVEERRGVPHHQMDVLDVTQDANVASYQERSREDLLTIAERGTRAMLVGGSGLYVRAALDVIDFPGTDPVIRAALEARLEEVGPGVLHAELALRDAEAAAQILPSNGRRIVRALEVLELTGGPFIARMPEHTYLFPSIQFAIAVPRDVLDERIIARVDRMWEDGLVDEIHRLDAVGLRSGRTARLAVGYAEACLFVDGEITEAEARSRTVTSTRRLAKRQESWFKRDARVIWLQHDESDLVGLAWSILADAGAL